MNPRISFVVKSNGVYNKDVGFIGFQQGIFKPEEFTQMVNQIPAMCWEKGERKYLSNNTNTQEKLFLFSSWCSEEIEETPINQDKLIWSLISRFEPFADALIEFKARHDVTYEIHLDLGTVGIEYPTICFDQRVIEFCHKTGTTIEIDTRFVENV